MYFTNCIILSTSNILVSARLMHAPWLAFMISQLMVHGLSPATLLYLFLFHGKLAIKTGRLAWNSSSPSAEPLRDGSQLADNTP